MNNRSTIIPDAFNNINMIVKYFSCHNKNNKNKIHKKITINNIIHNNMTCQIL